MQIVYREFQQQKHTQISLMYFEFEPGKDMLQKEHSCCFSHSLSNKNANYCVQPALFKIELEPGKQMRLREQKNKVLW